MKINWKEIAVSGLIFSIVGTIVSILLDHFWSDIPFENNIVTTKTGYRMLMFFVLGMFLKYRQNQKQPKKQ